MVMTVKERALWEIMTEAERNTVIARLRTNAAQKIKEKDYAKAHLFCELLLDRGDACGTCQYAFMLQHGLGGAKDLVKARDLYHQAADKGHAPAMCNYGWMLQYGLGGAQDLVKARGLYRQAAEKGYVPAMNNYGAMLFNGQGGAKDLVKARDSYRQAAKKGYGPAMNNYGLMLQNGLGGPQDLVKARDLFRQAAEKGYALAMNSYGCILQHGQGGAQDLVKARGLYRQAAEEGEANAMFNYAFMLGSGEGGDVNKGECQQFISQVANGFLQNVANRVQAIRHKIFALVTLVSRQHFPSVMNLASRYLRGDGVEENPVRAKEILNTIDMKAVPDKEAYSELYKACDEAIEDKKIIEAQGEAGDPAAKKARFG
ncbi:tetratricopeptide repeat protein [Candidatus Synchoanobacter obligatus]|uniref:Sel1 repeat family protein n=1 Tax=Candidatus Synchoanobacter obligatus TaxID=2919597 RepID=A0ABT1L660_9GAMM|nr:tetratricopeptide repeat protein [Candidatus Synchoanobacter obligatus]MCP8352661.1 sel1 repeat family protein [Candidatus Synchoanobacter obligatus]